MVFIRLFKEIVCSPTDKPPYSTSSSSIIITNLSVNLENFHTAAEFMSFYFSAGCSRFIYFPVFLYAFEFLFYFFLFSLFLLSSLSEYVFTFMDEKKYLKMIGHINCYRSCCIIKLHYMHIVSFHLSFLFHF